MNKFPIVYVSPTPPRFPFDAAGAPLLPPSTIELLLTSSSRELVLDIREADPPPPLINESTNAKCSSKISFAFVEALFMSFPRASGTPGAASSTSHLFGKPGSAAVAVDIIRLEETNSQKEL